MATYKKTAIDLSKLKAVRYNSKNVVKGIYYKTKNSQDYTLIWQSTSNWVIFKYSTPTIQEPVKSFEFTEGMTWNELATLYPTWLYVFRNKVIFAEMSVSEEGGMPEILTPFTFWVTLDGIMPVNGTDTVTGTEKIMPRTI